VVPVIVRALTFPVPPAVVWDVLVDLDRQPSWMHDLKSVRSLSAGPLTVGFRAVGRVRMFGVTQDDPIEVTYLDPGRHYGISHGGGFAGRADFWLEALPGGRSTRVTWREELRPDARGLGLPAAAGPLLRLLDPLFGPLFGVIFRADLRRLRELSISG
jgi:uncharacterized protein YndB with AHSA1/START domain